MTAKILAFDAEPNRCRERLRLHGLDPRTDDTIRCALDRGHEERHRGNGVLWDDKLVTFLIPSYHEQPRIPSKSPEKSIMGLAREALKRNRQELNEPIIGDIDAANIFEGPDE